MKAMVCVQSFYLSCHLPNGGSWFFPLTQPFPVPRPANFHKAIQCPAVNSGLLAEGHDLADNLYDLSPIWPINCTVGRVTKNTHQVGIYTIISEASYI